MKLIAEPGQVSPAPPGTGDRWTRERVLSIRHWTPILLSFRTTRYAGFRFTPGHYARLGLTDGAAGNTVWRPYSIVSASHADYLEFLAVRVPGGAFSERLATLSEGNTIFVEKPSYGFMTLDQLAPGRDLWLIASGTGLGPFISILQEPDLCQHFSRLIVIHSVRHQAELAYRDDIASLQQQALQSGTRLEYVPIVTREPGVGLFAARIPLLLDDGRLERRLGPLSVADSRVMVCGNPELTAALRRQLLARGFATARRGIPGQMAFENYW